MKLHGERLILTSVTDDIAEVLLPAYNGDEQFNLWSCGTPTLTLATVHADMRQTLSLPDGAIWRIADHAGALIGVAETALWPSPSAAWIALLLIRRAFQGRGSGSEAAALLERHLFMNPAVSHIGLAVLAQNAPALTFWEKRGYVRSVRRRDNHGNDVYVYQLLR
jgi:RimJ/RimL family protein N-acetyltransferase